MKVKILQSCGGQWGSYSDGDIIEVTDANRNVIESLLRGGLAEELGAPPPKSIEPRGSSKADEDTDVLPDSKIRGRGGRGSGKTGRGGV